MPWWPDREIGWRCDGWDAEGGPGAQIKGEYGFQDRTAIA
jgi:hypothetical protein